MALVVKDTESKVTVAKRTITVKDASVKDLRFVDETGDITAEVLNQIPEGIDEIDLKITIELPEEE